VALSDGAVTCTDGRFRIDVPGARIDATGGVEVSVRTSSGAKAALDWLAGRARAALPGAANAIVRAAAAAPKATVAIYARDGSVEVASSPGPVRNSLERHTLHKGQALVLIESKVYLLTGVDDDAPPERASLLGGLPVPPGSQFLTPLPIGPPGGAVATVGAGAPGTLATSGGPVRNSLERTLGDPASDPAVRVYALSIFESVGGADAVDAAAKAAGDPAVEVRAAAVRILALNSGAGAGADRPKALEALRRLAKDPDEGVAVFAVRALRALEDRGAIPVLQSMVVDDDAPPDVQAGVPAAPEAAQVAAFKALVYFGDTSRVAAAATHLPRLDPETEPGRTLQFVLKDAFHRLPAETVRQFLGDPRPGVKAAALLASNDLAAAKAALGDASPAVRLAAATVLLMNAPTIDYEAMHPLVLGASEVRAALLREFQHAGESRDLSGLPDWVRDAARLQLEDPASGFEACVSAVVVLKGPGGEDLFGRLMVSGTPAQKAAILLKGEPVPSLVLAALGDPDPSVRRLAILRLPVLTRLPAEALSTEDCLAALGKFAPEGFEQARLKAFALLGLARERKAEGAVQALLEMAGAAGSGDRRAAAYGLGPLGSRPDAAAAIEKLLADPDRETAEAASDQFARAALRAGWAGHSPSQVFPLASVHPVVRAQVALAARAAGVAGASEAVRKEMAAAPSSVRLRILERGDWSAKPLDFVEPSVLQDPEPSVRLRTLLATEGNPQVEAARALATDPAFWVQGAALAVLAKSGDAAALEGLRALVGDRQAAAPAGDPLLAGIVPASDTLPDQVLRSGRMVSSSANVALQTADPASAAEMMVLADISKARRRASVLGASPDREARVAAAAGLDSCRVPEAVEILAWATDPAREPEAAVRDAAAGALNRLLWFTPRPDAKAWFAAHRRLFVADAEIGARAGR
jgi:HEAT repeat protein